MTRSAQHFEDFAPHTLLKHRTFRDYVERWPRILLARPPFKRLRIVDACAGAGSDAAGNPGSPVIAAEEADRAVSQMSASRGEALSVEVVAIEKTRNRFRKLAERMSRYEGRHRALQGTLADYIGELERDFATVPTLFFIDPFGLEPLRAEVVRRCMKGPKNEIFLLFADQAALRHYGVIEAAAEDESTAQPSLFGDELPRVAPSEELGAIGITAEAAERIMDAVYGDLDWRAALSGVEKGQRRQKFVDIYVDLLYSYGAARVLPLPIIHHHHKYHLVYATKSPVGYRIMKEEIERSWGKGIVGARETDLMKLGTAWNRKRLLEAVLERFQGREVKWSNEDDGEISVRRYALEYTPAMPHQMEQLKEDLAKYRLPGRVVQYRFPPLT